MSLKLSYATWKIHVIKMVLVRLILKLTHAVLLLFNVLWSTCETAFAIVIYSSGCLCCCRIRNRSTKANPMLPSAVHYLTLPPVCRYQQRTVWAQASSLLISQTHQSALSLRQYCPRLSTFCPLFSALWLTHSSAMRTCALSAVILTEQNAKNEEIHWSTAVLIDQAEYWKALLRELNAWS